MKQKINILFLCTGNSCRSQIAEGWAKYFGHDLFEIQFAGIEAHGKNPRAINIMQVFRASRDNIKIRVNDLLQKLQEASV